MTKLRHPLTPYRALSRIADLIGWDGCAAVTGKSEWTMRKYADPDAERDLSLLDAMRLDIAFRRQGGAGAPLFEAYSARLDLELLEADDTAQLIAAVRNAAREGGEAVDAALSGGDRNAAIREADEAVAAFTSLRARLLRGLRGERTQI